MIGLRRLSLAAVAALTVWPGAATAGSVLGRWRIVRIAGYGEVSSGEAQARRAIGRSVTIRADAILLPGDPCTGHPLAHDTVRVDDFLLTSWRVSRADLKLRPFRLGDTAEHVDAVCADALVLDRDTLLLSSGGGAVYIVSRAR